MVELLVCHHQTGNIDGNLIEPVWEAGSTCKLSMESYKEYEKDIPGSNVQGCILAGLNHEQEFNHIEPALPVILDLS